MAKTLTKAYALDWIFIAEGGEANNPNDPGGHTKYGVSLRYLKSKGKLGDVDGDGDVDDKDISSLTPGLAAPFYMNDYWLPCRCDELPAGVAIAVFDCAVNSGPRAADRLLQQTLKVKVDGKIGPITIKAAHQQSYVLQRYLGIRARYYHDITLANTSLATFLTGWFNRLFHLQQYILKNEV